MRCRRCLALIVPAGLMLALALASGAQEPLPPVPSKVLPSSPGPGVAPTHSFTSPVTRTAYAIRVEPEAFDSDAGEEQEAPDEAAAEAAPRAALAAPAPSAAAATASIPPGEFYKGTARKAAKLSIADAPLETFNDLNDLIATLPSKASMVNHSPPITTQVNSNRVAEETRNVRVRCWLYAASREADNDFHLILGRAPGLTPERYMTMELAGLPPTNAKSFPQLKAARDAYNGFFGSNRPGPSYDFYNPPIPVLVEGSLFFDASHATGTPPGPSSLRPRMPTIWEVHPITRIVFEPQGPTS
jgi:hypothetical protein